MPARQNLVIDGQVRPFPAFGLNKVDAALETWSLSTLTPSQSGGMSDSATNQLDTYNRHRLERGR